MDWNSLGSLFFLELTLGTFVFLALVARAPLGPLFFRLNGGLAVLTLIAAWWLRFWKASPEGIPFALLAGGSGLGLLAYSFACGRVRSELRWRALWTAAAGFAAALGGAVLALSPAHSGWRALFWGSAAASGLVVGGVGISMALGHSYLTVPGLEVSYLALLNGASLISMVLKVLCVGALLLVCAAQLDMEGRTLFRPMGYFHLGSRLVVGLLLPMLFGWMVFGCLKHKATRSATGILYASTVLVILGEAMGLSLWGSFGVPL